MSKNVDAGREGKRDGRGRETERGGRERDGRGGEGWKGGGGIIAAGKLDDT